MSASTRFAATRVRPHRALSAIPLQPDTAHSTIAGDRLPVRLVSASDAAQWNRLARSLPGGTAFHDWDFLDLQERLFGVVIDRWIVEADGVPVGILPLTHRSRHSARSRSLEVPFLGPAVPEQYVAAVLRALRRHQWQSALMLAHLDIAPSLAPAAAHVLQDLPLRARHDGTVQVDLSHRSEEQLDARMGKSRRRLIRRSAEQGVEARAARPGELAAMLGPALAASYARRGARSPYSEAVGAIIEDWAVDRPEVLISVALVDDRVVSADVTLGSHEVAVGWVGARAEDCLEGHADAVLTRYVLLRAMRAGHTALDLAGRVDDDVERYKLSFGGAAVPYLVLESSLAPRAAVALARRAAAARRPATATSA